METKSLTSNFIKYIFGNIGVFFISLISTPIITRIVIPETYARYSLFLNIANMMVFIVSLGIDQAITRFYYNYRDNKGVFIKKIVIIPMVIFLIFSILFLKFNNIISEFIFGIPSKFLVIMLLLYIGLLTENRISTLLLRLEGRAFAYSIVNITSKCTFLILFLFLVYFGRANEEKALIIALVSSVLFISCYAYAINRKKINLKGEIKDIDITYKDILVYSIPLAINNFAHSFYQFIDKLAIKIFLSYELLGIYSSALVFQTMLNIFVVGYNNFWFPTAMQMYSSNPNNKAFFEKISQVIIAHSMLVATIIILFRQIIINFLGESYQSTIIVIPFLILIPCLNIIMDTISLGIVFKGKTYITLIATIIIIILAIALNIILVPSMGIRGASFSVVLSTVLLLIIRGIFSVKYYKVNYHLTKMLSIIFCVIGYGITVSYNLIGKYDAIIGLITIIIIICMYYRYTVVEWKRMLYMLYAKFVIIQSTSN